MATADYDKTYANFTWTDGSGTTTSTSSTPMTRKRLVELTKLAKETVDLLEKKGVTRDEACEFGRVCEKMFGL